ncbi:hypothetical protein AVEN_201107-1 [Araneus ventricosus]|uniref:Tc1-like transposase DDE domain-containing protein n=1 Tax=Araneus ventricosus TaxID=182803 RepID=A0A4Y2UA25_ARAVE|nr:hypothetical protein AVEN_240775-1 [Araneus ventricosus]GBO08387.1 hypothetical protein AVEN_201107-1 [Araneus ventricosus]
MESSSRTTPHVTRLGWCWSGSRSEPMNNSTDLNPMEHIWDVMERQLRAQAPLCPNISTLRDRCLDSWYNLSPVMYQKLLAFMPRRVAAVLKAKGDAARYCVVVIMFWLFSVHLQHKVVVTIRFKALEDNSTF